MSLLFHIFLNCSLSYSVLFLLSFSFFLLVIVFGLSFNNSPYLVLFLLILTLISFIIVCLVFTFYLSLLLSSYLLLSFVSFLFLLTLSCSVLFSFCCILTSDPAKHAIPKTAEEHIPLAWASLADNKGPGKIQRYSQTDAPEESGLWTARQLFPLDDNQTSHSKTAEVTHPDGQLCGDIEWAIELLYNSVKTGSQLVWRPVWSPDPLVTRCGRENQHPAETSGWAAQENWKETWLWPIEWGSICCSSVRSPTPSQTQTFQMKWEVYFSKRLCGSSSSFCRCVLHESAYDYTTILFFFLLTCLCFCFCSYFSLCIV